MPTCPARTWSGTDLTGANLTDAILTGTNLTDAILTGTTVTGVQGLPTATPDRRQTPGGLGINVSPAPTCPAKT